MDSSSNDPNASLPPQDGTDSRLRHMASQGLTPSRALQGSQPNKTWEPPTPEELQDEIGTYKVLELVGRGGMGAVYKGWQVSLERYVAIKVLPPLISEGIDSHFAERFKQEAKTMAKFMHPGIVAVHDAGETSHGLLYIVMEFVEGTDVSQMIRTQGKLPPEHALAITAHVCDALLYAHKRGIVHRDIKPANIMMNLEGQVKVADFGLAKSSAANQHGYTRTDMTVGTPDFIAPEALIIGINADHRADLYAVGVMLYNMLTGEIPRGMFRFPSQKLGTDPRFDDIIRKAMESEREHRYQSAEEIRRDLDVILSSPVEKAAAQKKPVATPPAKSATASKPPPQEKKASKAQPAAAAPRKKSSAGMMAGIAGAMAVISLGAFMVFKKPALSSSRREEAPSASGGASSSESLGKSQSLVTSAATSSLAAATKDAPFVNSLGMKFVPVPGTKALFSIWVTRVQDYAAYAKANQGVNDRWTKQEMDGVPVSREPEYPVVGVNWNEAQAFCKWLTEKETAEGKLPKGAKYRLPSDEEWSWAVAMPPEVGGTPEEKNGKNDVDFPWGREWPPVRKVGNYADETFHTKFPKPDAKDPRFTNAWMKDYTDGFVTTSPVGAFPANVYGLSDMGGNVWQWCEDWWNAEHKDRVVRGASWGNFDRGMLRSSNRHRAEPTHRYIDRGFRCVVGVSAPGSASASAAASSPAPAATPAAPNAIPGSDSTASNPKSATKDAPFVNTLGMKFVPVPGTKVLFSIWDTRVQDYAAYAKANQRVNDRWTKQEMDGVPVSREPEYPVVGVNWNEAQAFCKWLTEKETSEAKLPKGAKYRLPTDAEWSMGVGLPPETGATPEEKHRQNVVDFPWGKVWPPPQRVGNYADEAFHAKFLKEKWVEGYTDGYETTSPVGSFPANAYGLYDMGGNVWQWCEDKFSASGNRTARSAPWVGNQREILRSSRRGSFSPIERANHLGFRCVLESDPSAIVTSLVAQPPTPTPSPSANSTPKQTIDLLALTDPMKDRVDAPGNTGANNWSRSPGGSLIYQTDGKSGKLIPPVAIDARSYEIELAYQRKYGEGGFNLDLPVESLPSSVPFYFHSPSEKLISNKFGDSWPKGLPANGTIIVRCDTAASGQSHVTITRDGKTLTEWTGNLRELSKKVQAHPAFPDQLLISLFCHHDSYEFTTWKLRVFAGEAKVLRPAASATTAVESAPVPSTTTSLPSPKNDPWVVYPPKAGPGAGRHIVFLSGDEEYRSEESLPMLAKILSQRHGFKCTVLFAVDADGNIKPDVMTSLPGAEALDSADAIVMLTRYRAWPDGQMKHFADAYLRGVPIIGLRTATHAFKPPAGSSYAASQKFGENVFGSGWVKLWSAPNMEATRGIIEPTAKADPILNGVADIFGNSSTYEVNMPPDAKVLVRGQVLTGMNRSDPPATYTKVRADKSQQSINNPMMPVAWTRTHSNPSGRTNAIFCTTMGAATDFENEGLRRLVVNAVYSLLGLEVPVKADVDYVGEYRPGMYGFNGYKQGVKPADLALPAGQ